MHDVAVAFESEAVEASAPPPLSAASTATSEGTEGTEGTQVRIRTSFLKLAFLVTITFSTLSQLNSQ